MSKRRKETRRSARGNAAKAAAREAAAVAAKQAEDAARLAVQEQALELRIAGASFRAIAKQLGIGLRQAYELVSDGLAALKDDRDDAAERLRALEVERCDRMTLALGRKVVNGEERAVRAAVAVMDRRAKLLGLDAPVKVEHSDGGLVDRLNAARKRAPMPPASDGA